MNWIVCFLGLATLTLSLGLAAYWWASLACLAVALGLLVAEVCVASFYFGGFQWHYTCALIAHAGVLFYAVGLTHPSSGALSEFRGPWQAAGLLHWVGDGLPAPTPEPPRGNDGLVLDASFGPEGTPYVLLWNGVGKVAGGRYIQIAPAPEGGWNATNHFHARLLAGRDGKLWVVDGRNLYSCEGRRAAETPTGLGSVFESCIAEAHDGSLLMATKGALYSVSDGKATRLATLPFTFQIHDLLPLPDGRVAVLAIGGAAAGRRGRMPVPAPEGAPRCCRGGQQRRLVLCRRKALCDPHFA